MALSMFIYGTALYVRTGPFRGGSVSYDKMWRFLVGGPVTAVKNGAIDCFGERLIPTKIGANFSAAYAQSPVIMRYGDEESPNIIVGINDVPTAVGGNHKIGGQSTITAYSKSLIVNGRTQLVPGRWVAGSKLTVTERYYVIDPTNPGHGAYGRVTITREFTNSDFCRFIYQFVALTAFDLSWFAGVMAQGLAVKAGQTLHLRIPGSTPYNGVNGVDITNQATDIEITPDLWMNGIPPSNFETFVKQKGAPQFSFVMAFDAGSNRGSPGRAFFRPAATRKTYPVAMEFVPPKAVSPGEIYGISGYFGCYNGHH